MKYLKTLPYPFNIIWDNSPELEDDDLIFDNMTQTILSDISDEIVGELITHLEQILPSHYIIMILYRYRDKKTYREIGELFDVSIEHSRQIIARGLRKCKHILYNLKYTVMWKLFERLISDDESLKLYDLSHIIEYKYMTTVDVCTLMCGEPPFLKQLVWLVLDEEIRKVNGDMESLNVSEIVDRMHQHIHYKKIMDIGVLNYIYEKEAEDIKKKNMKNTDIGDVGFSLRTYRSLYRYGICTLGDIIKYTKEDLEKIRNLNVKGVEEIEEVLAKHGLELAPSKECENVDEMSIEELDLSLRSFNVLMHNNIRTIGDLRNADITDLRKLRGMGEKSINEIIDKLEGFKQ